MAPARRFHIGDEWVIRLFLFFVPSSYGSFRARLALRVSIASWAFALFLVQVKPQNPRPAHISSERIKSDEPPAFGTKRLLMAHFAPASIASVGEFILP